ncbi:MAG: murein L,D-transpeptidase [Burkholderiales bacterium]|nr:MAG: murein L,D-transpeptidase [Burkholderiales bacterium]
MKRAAALCRRVRHWCLALCLGLAGAALASAADVAWFDAGRPIGGAQQAIVLLRAAPSHGLDPSDYGTDALEKSLWQVARQVGSPDAETVSRLDRALTDAMVRYLEDLHHGRVNPRQLGVRFRPSRRDAFDARAVLREALAAGDLGQAVDRAVPPLQQYEQLRQALQRYQGLQGHAAWQQPLPALPSAGPGRPGRLEPGARHAGLHLLAWRLETLGDLPSAATQRYRGNDAVYDDELVAAVRRFQRRHGLTVDGVPGRRTWAQLAVPPEERVVQIGLALERLRWTPLLQSRRMVVVNIPEFVLRAYEQTGQGVRVITEMRIIAGRAARHSTPLFDEDMRFIEFSPYWNVPRSIAAEETVPRLRRDPGYLDRLGFEIVERDGTVRRSVSDELLADVLAGRALLRQRPGPENALGDIKFVFPNRDSIFLHHTPSVGLFQRDQRDFSHGCIRVEDPVALARFVMQEMPGWTEERIVGAMRQGESQTVRLNEPLPVVIAYVTTLVKNGEIHFFDDIYGHDRVLRDALKARRGRSGAATGRTS